jgi:hypothetical protein
VRVALSPQIACVAAALWVIVPLGLKRKAP